MEFVRADELVKKSVREFEGIYRAYNINLLDYENVLDYIDCNPIIKGLFIKYITEKIRDKFEKFNLSDLVNIKGYFNPFYEPISELIDDFMDWLRFRGYLGDQHGKTQL